MKLATPICPTCGAQAEGTLETCPCKAMIQPDRTKPDPGEFEYAGETVMFWDEQKPVLGPGGGYTLICHQGHTWESASDDDNPTDATGDPPAYDYLDGLIAKRAADRLRSGDLDDQDPIPADGPERDQWLRTHNSNTGKPL